MRVRAPLAACMRRMGCPDARTKRSAFFLCLLPVEMRCFSFAGGMAVHGPPVPCPAEPASAPGGSLATRPSHVAPPPPLGVLVDEQRVRLGVEDVPVAQRHTCTPTLQKPPLSGPGCSGYPPVTVPGMRKCRTTPHSGCVLTVVVTCIRGGHFMTSVKRYPI